MSYKKIVENAIDDLIGDFFKHPDYFLTESDLHAYLFKLIYEKLEKNGRLENKWGNNHRFMVVHREYPTYQRYKKYLKTKKLIPDIKGNKGHFDLVILDGTAKNLVDVKGKAQKIHIAIEFKMNEKGSIDTLKRMIHNDLLKLGDPVNKVEHGYFLFVIRHGEHEKLKWDRHTRMLNDNAEPKTAAIVKKLVNERKISCYFIEYDDRWPERLKKELIKNYNIKKRGNLYFGSKNNLQIIKKDGRILK